MYSYVDHQITGWQDSQIFGRKTLTPLDGKDPKISSRCQRGTTHGHVAVRIELLAIESDGTAADGSGGDGSLTMDAESCEHMFEQCSRGNSVTLVRLFPEAGQDSMIRLCPFRHGTLSRHDRSIMNTADGELVTIERAAEGHCTMSGEAATSKEGGRARATSTAGRESSAGGPRG